MRSVIRASAVLAVFLLVPIIPFLVLGESFEQDVKHWIEADADRAEQVEFASVLGILASDIFLPIPSSAVMTYAGGVMSFWGAVLASWTGLTLGAALGFGFSRTLGKQFAARFAEAEDLARIESASKRFGPAVLLATRPLPILAEACVLLLGTTQLSWRRFLLPVIAANLAMAVFYVACGAGIEDQRLLVAVAIGSGTVPLLLALIIRRKLTTRLDAQSTLQQTEQSHPQSR
jgi:uncharacterized membrane protein YdjX (TVP38/TMEM64 family)